MDSKVTRPTVNSNRTSGDKALKKQRAIRLILVSIDLLALCILCRLPTPITILTKQRGPELQFAYENYESAVALAYETGDAFGLDDMATGYELDHLIQAVDNNNAQVVAEWHKVEVVSITVTEYTAKAAQATIQVRVVGDINRPGHKNVWVVDFMRDEDTWKVSGVGSYFTND